MAVDPVSIGLAAGQTAIGIAQRAAANRRRKRALAQFKYDIPSATQEQVRLAREYASRSGLPGEDITRARLESDLAGAVLKGEGAASTSEEVLGMYGKMFGQKTDINRQLLEAGAKYKSEQEANLARSLGLMANAEEQQFYYNKYVPFMSEMGYAGDQAQGGAANIASGLQTAYSAWENQWMMDAWKDIYGTNPSAAGMVEGGNPMTISPMQDSPLSLEPWATNEQTWNVPEDGSYGYPAPNFDMGGYMEQPQNNFRGWNMQWNNWQVLPQWQQQNPVNYPARWMKYEQ